MRKLMPLFVLFVSVSCVEQRPARNRPVQPTQPQGGYPPPGGYQAGAPGPGYCDSKQQRASMCPGERLKCTQHDAACASLLRSDFLAAYSDCVRRHPCVAADIDDLCIGITLRSMPLVTPMQNQVQQACLARASACPGKMAENCRALPRTNEQVLHAVHGCFSHPDCTGVERCVEHTLDRFGCR